MEANKGKKHERNYAVSTINATEKLKELFYRTDDEYSKKLIIEVLKELKNADIHIIKEFILPKKKD